MTENPVDLKIILSFCYIPSYEFTMLVCMSCMVVSSYRRRDLRSGYFVRMFLLEYLS